MERLGIRYFISVQAFGANGPIGYDHYNYLSSGASEPFETWRMEFTANQPESAIYSVEQTGDDLWLTGRSHSTSSTTFELQIEFNRAMDQSSCESYSNYEFITTDGENYSINNLLYNCLILQYEK